MLIQLVLATVAVVATALIHLSGLTVLTHALRFQNAALGSLRAVRLSLLLMATIGIVCLHTVEIWSYASLYLALHALNDFEQALYFSTSTYASIGYGDVLLPHQWRVLGAIEGAAGTIMLGWSTAYLVLLLTRLKMFGGVRRGL